MSYEDTAFRDLPTPELVAAATLLVGVATITAAVVAQLVPGTRLLHLALPLAAAFAMTSATARVVLAAFAGGERA